MSDLLLDPSGLWVPSDYADGFYVAKKSGRRFTDWRRLVAGTNVTLGESGTTVEINSTASGSTYAYHGCAATRTTTQSIASTGTAVQFNVADEWDTDSIHDPSTNNTRFTIPSGLDGKWNFIAMLAWVSSSNSRSIQWSKNGTSLGTLYRPVSVTPATATSMRQNAVVDLDLAAGDYVECVGFPSATQDISEARLTCHFLG